VAVVRALKVFGNCGSLIGPCRSSTASPWGRSAEQLANRLSRYMCGDVLPTSDYRLAPQMSALRAILHMWHGAAGSLARAVDRSLSRHNGLNQNPSSAPSISCTSPGPLTPRATTSAGRRTFPKGSRITPQEVPAQQRLNVSPTPTYRSSLSDSGPTKLWHSSGKSNVAAP
jgi:hypothetical protein